MQGQRRPLFCILHTGNSRANIVFLLLTRCRRVRTVISTIVPPSELQFSFTPCIFAMIRSIFIHANMTIYLRSRKIEILENFPSSSHNITFLYKHVLVVETRLGGEDGRGLAYKSATGGPSFLVQN